MNLEKLLVSSVSLNEEEDGREEGGEEGRGGGRRRRGERGGRRLGGVEGVYKEGRGGREGKVCLLLSEYV